MATPDSTADVIVVGAGLAGLTAARALSDLGRHVVVLDEAEAPGGRVRTDVIDGFTLDRGFQQLNPAYPQLLADVDLVALDLCRFPAGAAVAYDETRAVLGDPRRLPSSLLSSLRFPLATGREKLAVARLLASVGFLPARRIKRRTDTSLAERLAARGVTGGGHAVLAAFLAGVLADADLTTSARFAELLLRAFVRGTPAVPAAGMQALPEQLARRLPPQTLQLRTPVLSVAPGYVRTGTGVLAGRAVIVATDPRSAARLLGRPPPAMRGLTTFYHRAPVAPTDRAEIHLDAQRRGPVANTVVISNAAPTYADSSALVASTILGADGSADSEKAVRRHVETIYGCSAATWDLVAAYALPHALPDTPAGTPLRRPVIVGDGVFVAGDHRDTASIQGAMVSGRRAAAAVEAWLT